MKLVPFIESTSFESCSHRVHLLGRMTWSKIWQKKKRGLSAVCVLFDTWVFGFVSCCSNIGFFLLQPVECLGLTATLVIWQWDLEGKQGLVSVHLYVYHVISGNNLRETHTQVRVTLGEVRRSFNKTKQPKGWIQFARRPRALIRQCRTGFGRKSSCSKIRLNKYQTKSDRRYSLNSVVAYEAKSNL